MTIKDYFKKELEKKFLYTQVLNTKRFQEIINDEFNGAAIINDKNFITFNFEDNQYQYKLNVKNGQLFKIIASIEYVT